MERVVAIVSEHGHKRRSKDTGGKIFALQQIEVDVGDLWESNALSQLVG